MLDHELELRTDTVVDRAVPQSVPTTVEFRDGELELRVESAMLPTVLRTIGGTTPMDAAVAALELPEKPAWLSVSVRLLRWYRQRVSPQLGPRCGLEPSCSHYAELAVRRHGPFLGCTMTIARLRRCRPGAGGVDVP